MCAAVVAVTGGIACASPGVPPGGPERHTPPAIVRIQPDTNTVNFRGKEFVVTFDEVISERPNGAATLNDLVLVSPREGQADVEWHRDAISIHPRKGWRKNTAYTVTLLPGISDLRGNIRGTSTTVTFSTGPVVPPTHLRGILFDWLTGVPIVAGMIEAHAADTTLVYVGITDSVGRFDLRGLTPDQYAVRGYLDQNRNRGLDPGEAFDSTHVALRDSVSLELLAFSHDSLGPHLGSVVAEDSTRVRAIFDTPLDPRVPLDVSRFVLTGRDSAQIPIRSVAAARADTAHAATPNLPPISQTVVPIPQPKPSRTGRPNRPSGPLPKPTRALLFRDVLLELGARLRPGATYRLQAINATGPTGKTLTSDRTFTVPNFANTADSLKKRTPVPTPPAPTRPLPIRARER